jgi:hypothetical protein
MEAAFGETARRAGLAIHCGLIARAVSASVPSRSLALVSRLSATRCTRRNCCAVSAVSNSLRTSRSSLNASTITVLTNSSAVNKLSFDLRLSEYRDMGMRWITSGLRHLEKRVRLRSCPDTGQKSRKCHESSGT